MLADRNKNMHVKVSLFVIVITERTKLLGTYIENNIYFVKRIVNGGYGNNLIKYQCFFTHVSEAFFVP